jgi:glycosyltransferase involved in cell wall biosynthesis
VKILVISQYFYPENFRINTLCRELVSRGHEVTVMTAYPQYPGGEIFEGYGFDVPYEREWHGVRIHRVKTYPRGRGPLGLLRNTVSFVVSGNRWVRRCEEKFDAVFVFEVSPVTVGLPAVTYKKKFGTPIFFNLQDLWPENVHEVLGLRFPPLTWVINWIVNRIYKNSDKILCTSQGFVENLKQKGVPAQKLEFWPQFCLDPQMDASEKPNAYPEDRFNIVFTGNLGAAQGLDLMIEAARQLKGRGIRWYLVGDGRAKQHLEALVREYDLESDVIFVGRVSESEANGYVAQADCAYLSFRDNPLFHMTLPAKLQTYLACGVPVLAAAGGESAAIINGAACGIAAEARVDALVNAALQMASKTPEQRAEMARAARRYYEDNFTMQDLVDRLEAMLPRN